MGGSRYDELVAELVDDVRPVRRLWPPVLRLGLWLLVVALVLGGMATVGLRPDLITRLRDPLFLLELVAIFGGATLLAILAFRSAVPGRDSRRWEKGLAGGMLTMAGVLGLRFPADTDLALSRFMQVGAACALRTVLIASIPLLALLVALRRGAPLAPGRAGAFTGAAAFIMAFGLMRLACPLDDVIHVFVWHAVPALAGVGVSTFAGLAFLRGWRS